MAYWWKKNFCFKKPWGDD